MKKTMIIEKLIKQIEKHIDTDDFKEIPNER